MEDNVIPAERRRTLVRRIESRNLVSTKSRSGQFYMQRLQSGRLFNAAVGRICRTPFAMTRILRARTVAAAVGPCRGRAGGEACTLQS